MRAPPESLSPITRSAGLQRQVHDLDDLPGVGLRQRSAEDREILREDVSRAAMNQAPAGDEAVAVDHLILHAEIARVMAHQLVGFLERALVEQQIDALARGEFAFGVLLGAALLAPAGFSRGMAAAQFFETVGHKRLG